MPLTLSWTDATTLPVASDALRADGLAGLSPVEAASLPARIGNQPATLGDLFRIEGDASHGPHRLGGDLRHVRGIGAGMVTGSLIVEGDVGPYFAAAMAGGSITLIGSASTWAGAEMRGGRLHIRGSTGDYLGAAEPGSRRGMREGMILVEGPVGAEVGLAMRRGLIAVTGSSGPGLGRGLIAGTILSLGPVGRLAGSGMKRGTLALVDPGPDFEPLATFAASGRYRFPFLAIYLRFLRDQGFPIPPGLESRAFDRYNGDLLDGGQGELLTLAPV
ncbi:formylmethanofuran dehydrogenase subunit C [Tautonia rosea]|uniref:formylmethanofuran dehydrogenase subunit C n=1 Tax=Tautonia rosea TaxID=2728037 RepID=UPI0014729C3A|nr:formylmethanofuran dehydrogenase subunit C [Tautonia rosea]